MSYLAALRHSRPPTRLTGIPTVQTEAPTFTAPPPLPTEIMEPTIPPTATPYSPITVSSMVDHLNIRGNPGKLFDVTSNLAQGSQVQIIGKAPGGEWFLVQEANGAQGWVFGQLLESDQNLQAVPVIMPANVVVLEGRIVKENGQPVSGIQFAFVQENYGQILRNDGNSDENGVFFVFMPPDISGEWVVSYTAISCTSNTMDSGCNCIDGICGTVSPSVQTITLPQVEPVLFSWVYAR
ncbi:MAG: SH3 domain-containing protein [Anaerolineaceae bacterium]